MARLRNITADTLTLFRADAPPVYAGDEITVRDEVFVDRAWPKSTWDLIDPPTLEGFEQVECDDAYIWQAVTVPAFDPSEHNVDDVLAYLATADDAERARVIEAEAAGKARKSITEGA